MRLIDADALEKEIKEKDIMGGLNYRWYIQNAPTVDVLEQKTDLNEAVRIAYKQGRKDSLEVFDKIRAEIEQEADYQDAYVNADIAKGIYLALEIFDKYKGGDNK